MKAIAQDTYGPADVLQFRDIDRPTISDDEVLIEVRAAGVDPGVWHLMTGKPYLIRAMGFGLTKPKIAGAWSPCRRSGRSSRGQGDRFVRA